MIDPRRCPFTWTFLGLCWAVTVPGLVWPDYRTWFSGVGPGDHLWKPFTAVFQHGWPGFPAGVHLALNSALILALGPACERLLGSVRLLILSVAAAIANAVLQWTGEGVDGSSLVIWAWGPPVYLALRMQRDQETVGPGAPGDDILPVLVVMYVVITLAMPGIFYLAGWRGNPLVALILANQFHLMATLVGVAGAWWWRGVIREAVLQIEVT